MRGILIVLSMLFSLMMSGCSITASMVPVEGPLSQLRPVPIIEATVDGVMGHTGTISMTMPDGEQCSGRWSSAAGTGISYGSGSLFGTYGAAYGTGFAISTGHGQNPGQAFLTCNRGTTMQIEFVTGSGTAHGFGFAKDNNGNVYKLIF
jgi:hypothetical protein